MNILVFGGAGYIGSHTVKKLRDSGNVVYIADDFSSGSVENSVCLSEPNCVIYCDITSKTDVENAFEISKPDSVMLFAAKKSVAHSMSKENVDLYTDTNIIGACNVIIEAVKRNVKNFVFSSSAAVYGEPSTEVVDESTPTNPINYYGETKLIFEKILKWYCKITGMKGASLRYFNASGYDMSGWITSKEKEPENLIPIVMEVVSQKREKLQIYGNDYPTINKEGKEDGTCIRDYIHVDDLATAHLLALNFLNSKEEGYYSEFCLGTGRGTTVKEIVDTTEKITGKKCPHEFTNRRLGDPAKLTASSERALKELKWEPFLGIDEILSSTWSLYKE